MCKYMYMYVYTESCFINTVFSMKVGKEHSTLVWKKTHIHLIYLFMALEQKQMEVCRICLCVCVCVCVSLFKKNSSCKHIFNLCNSLTRFLSEEILSDGGLINRLFSHNICFGKQKSEPPSWSLLRKWISLILELKR